MAYQKSIPYFDEKISVEEYVKIQIVANRGSNSVAYKSWLEGHCRELGISVSSSDTKETLYDAIMAAGVSVSEMAKRYGVGVSTYVYQEVFHIPHKIVKKLEKKELIHVVGYYPFRAYGKELDMPLYDIVEFANMSDDDMENLINRL